MDTYEHANRVYIASKLGTMEPVVTDLRQRLEDRGYEIIYDWTLASVSKPFEEHRKEASRAARAMAEAVMRTDILIVLVAPDGVGYHIETGGALVSSIILSFMTGQKKKQIFVVGEGNDRSVFYFDESVERISDVDALLEYLPELSA